MSFNHCRADNYLILGKRLLLVTLLFIFVGSGSAISYTGVEVAITSVENSVNISEGAPLSSFAEQRALWQASRRLAAPDLNATIDSSSSTQALIAPSDLDSYTLDPRAVVITPISRFDVVVHVEIDQRIEALQPLSTYSLWDSLVISGENKTLTLLSDYQVIEIASQRSPLEPLAGLATDLPEDSFIEASEPRLYLSDLQTTLMSRLYHDDNLYASQSEQVSSWTFLNELTTSATLQRRNNTYFVSYLVRDGRVAQSAEDSYLDHRLYGQVRQDLSRIHSIRLSGYVYRTHETRGAGVAEGDITFDLEKPEKLTQKNFDFEYQLGDEGSQLRLISGVRYNDIRYDSGSALTAEFEYDQIQFDLKGFYRLGARTDLTMQVTRSEVDYLVDLIAVAGTPDTLDSSSQSFIAGIDRDIGRLSSGRFRFGASQRAFDDPDRAKRLDSYWDAEFIWRPRSYSTVNVGYKSRFSESRGLGDYIASRETLIGWNHSWATRLSSKLSLRYVTDDYVNFDRSDNRLDTNLRFLYTFNNRFSLASGARYHRRDSNQGAFDFDRKIIFFESSLRL